jgi:hypothetical protein
MKANSSEVGDFVLKVSKDDPTIGYLYLPPHPKKGIHRITRSIRLFELIGQYSGPDIILDFDEKDVLVGIEIV